MPKRNSKAKRPKRPADPNEFAYQIVKESTEPDEVEPDEVEKAAAEIVSQVMREMGRKGGKIGGKRRLQTMSEEQRSEVASRAAKARWEKKLKKPSED